MNMFKLYDIFEPHECGRDSHGSTVTELPNGDIMAVWYCGSFEKAADVAIYTSTLKKGMYEWTKPILLEKEADDKSEGNPVIYYDDVNERLWLFWATMDRAEYDFMPGGWSLCKLKCKHSEDAGKTWTEPRWLTKFWGRMTRNKPVRLSNGDVILPIYSEWMGYKTNFFIWTAEEFAKGALDSKFKKVGPVKGGIMQPTIVELNDKNGHLLCYNRTSRGGKFNGWITATESLDYGRHWNNPYQGPLPNPNSGCDMVKLTNGNIALAFNNSPNIRSPLSIGLSTDGGKTWAHIRDIVRDDKERFSYPGIIQSSDGTLWCSYTNKRGINICCAHFNEAWIKNED
ncbi:MAG: hypothetical protein GF364_11725 [Candidatus Lokiarchaeota archaeon]|nr:hypothetical protein [Candidatus Lokiarchaeota archaeon]